MATTLAAVNDLVAELVALTARSAAGSEPLSWSSAALLCARVLGRWGGQLGRGALFAQIQLELSQRDGAQRRRAGASALEHALGGEPREPSGVELPLELRIVSAEIVDGPGTPLVLATVREADRDERTAATAVLALPERLCALVRSPGLSALVTAGRMLRVTGPLVALRCALPTHASGRGVELMTGAANECVPVLRGADEEDDMLAMFLVTHSLAELDRAALDHSIACTLLCRVLTVELSPALARALGEPSGCEPACAPPPACAPSDEPLWARVLLADAAVSVGTAPGACAELLLVGTEAMAAACLAPRARALARGPCAAASGALVLVHSPFVERAHGAVGGERVLLRMGSSTILAPFDVAVAEPAAPPRAAPRAVAARAARAFATRALLGCCVPAVGAGLGWECPTAGGRVRCTLELRTAGALGRAQPLGELAPAARAAAATVRARVCAPAEAFARVRVPRARIDAVEPSAPGWCALAAVRLPLGECGHADGKGSGHYVTAAQLDGAPSCECAECAGERGRGGPRAIRAEELFLFAPSE